ncbi:MAG TPA: hypothetical protein VMF64_08300 [Steroidobacteraceae bacterium]|nr:hypothetical protein [Steroidobacteraceae bacterium]
MIALDNSKQSTAAPTSPRGAPAPCSDAPLGQHFEVSALRDASAELVYGCVDWFIYGAEARIGGAPASLTA